MSAESIFISNLQEFGMAISFIMYLIYQNKLSVENTKEERKLRIDEKNQFIKILEELKTEIKILTLHIKNK